MACTLGSFNKPCNKLGGISIGYTGKCGCKCNTGWEGDWCNNQLSCEVH